MSGRTYGQAGSRCPTCGKLRYPSRKDARRAASRIPRDGRLAAYECDGWWHLGHLPTVVRRGDLERANVWRPGEGPAR